MTQTKFLLPLLIVVLLMSGIAVIYSKYQQRLLFNNIQKEERRLNEYAVEWGRLQLELTMLTAGNRVERIAGKQLNMVQPVREDIVYIKP
jgi:cell division protein FtsL